jgi:ureidoglycolate lyase
MEKEMRKITLRELDRDSFGVYGSYGQLIDPKTEKIGREPIEFYRDMVQLSLGSVQTASISVCRVHRRPFVIDTAEYHDGSSEGILPLDGDVVIHVAPATPPGRLPLDRFEAFRVPAGTFVALRPGVWHHAAYALEGEVVNVLIVLPERAYAVDCEVSKISEEDQIEIET